MLVAEDEQALREFLDVALRLTGACVKVTSALPEALAALDSFDPQVVLFNVTLEDGGLSLAEATKARKIPTIALTGRLDDRALGVLMRAHHVAIVRVFDHVAVASAIVDALNGGITQRAR